MQKKNKITLKRLTAILLSLMAIVSSAWCDDVTNITVMQDTIYYTPSKVGSSDNENGGDKKTSRRHRKNDNDSIQTVPWRPDPSKAVWLGAIVPGLGQIYNRKYWKLPIIYGGFIGCIYAITWNNRMYQDYKMAYRDIIDTDESTNSFMDILPKGYTIEMMGGTENYANLLRSRQQRYHRFRDLSIVATVALYALTLVDAFVDAQLYEFDISPDLSMDIQPTMKYDPHVRESKSAELQFTIKF